MEMLERWLKQRPLLLTLLLAAGLAWAYSTDGIVSEDAMPLGDAEHYVLRGMTLYGYLHTGQWSQFWDVFTLPRQSIAPPHYWLFFLVPTSWAGMTAYGAILAVSTYGLLAVGAWSLCRALDRAEWTPALFLFCAAQNISLDFTYFYYIDVPFMAAGTLALAWQVGAWRRRDWRLSALSGAGAGLMFWIKAPNALIFSATFLIAELIRLALVWRRASGEGSAVSRRDVLGHAGAVAAGYLPITLLAMSCGGFQSIVKLIQANEVSVFFVTTLEATGLLRLFYFPLCLTIFYHTVLLLVIFAVVGFLAFRRYRLEKPPAAETSPGAPFPGSLLLPLLGAYLILGEYFSFGMQDKPMRSLLLLLPVLWLAAFWGLEKCRVRSGQLFLAAAFYVVCALSQIFFNGFETMDVNPEGYQLKGDWLFRLPQQHPVSLAEIQLTRDLIRLIHEAVPDGKIAIGTEQLYVTSESLTWCLEHDLALQGKPVPCNFTNFLTNQGQYSRSGLIHARAILVYVAPSLQYTKAVYEGSLSLIRFVGNNWLKPGKAQLRILKTEGLGVIGYMIVLKEPLTDEDINQIMAGTNATELSPAIEFNPPVDRRLTWPEESAILRQWEQKRLGLAWP